MWDLNRLGYTSFNFLLEENVENISFPFILPENASQGPDNWYLIHLNFRIKFDESSENGRVYVSAFTNGSSSAQVKFKTKRIDNNLIIDWGTVGLLGSEFHSTTSPVIDVSFSNYMQVAGVKPGFNLLTFKVDQRGGSKVESLKIFDSSGIESPPISPPRLEMNINIIGGPLRVGDHFTIKFLVRNVGDLPAENIVVKAFFPEALGQLCEFSASGS